MTTHAPLQRHAPRTPSRHRLRKWSKRVVLGVVAIAGVAALVRAWLPSPVTVDVVRAGRQPLDVEVAEDGQTRVRDRFVITAPTTGMLDRIELEPGSIVAVGEAVAKIAPPDPSLLDRRARDEGEARLAGAIARLRRADTMIARARVARDAAIRESARGRQLAERGAIGGAERDRLDVEADLAIRDVGSAETERAAAAAEVSAARAILAADRPSTAQRPVIAPVSGRVLRVIRESAGPVAAGAPLVEVGDVRATEVVVDVLSSDAVHIREGMEAAIEGWGGEPLTATVRRVEPSAFTRVSALGVEEQRVNVILDARLPDAIGDGFRVDVRIFLWRGTGVLAVPASAVFRDRDRWALYTVEDGRARLRPVVIGHRGRMAVEIEQGIADGTQVILHPGDRVSDGARVAPR